MPQQFIFVFIGFAVFVALMVALQFWLRRKTCYYTFNGRRIKVFKGFINAHLFIDNQMVDHQRCWGQGVSNVVLQHKEEGMEIFVRVTSGFLRPRITMKINNQLTNPD